MHGPRHAEARPRPSCLSYTLLVLLINLPCTPFLIIRSRLSG
ncbi:putative signal peptide protein [Puccinia sorghi]|uniref:Putative signal peptide protein n=1 Tax=Puccinia sorghi TaxID=27349 RepID=A0A0L6VHY0_9BASI|nr:putative signal peptide protein [Puccinia sorghi]